MPNPEPPTLDYGAQPRAPRGLGVWLGRGIWAIADQGFFAGGNFLANILLARNLSQPEYGAFAIAFTLFLLAGLMHTACLTEPMLIFGPGRFQDRQQQYLAALVWGHALFSIPTAALLAAAGGICWLAGSSSLGVAVLAFAVMSPLILLLWLMRRACYLKSNPQLAATAGLAYLVFMAVSIWCLPGSGLTYMAMAIGVMGLGSVAAAAWLASRLRPAFATLDRDLGREIAREHFRYGRWAVSTGVVYFITGQMFTLILPWFGGLSASGAFRAVNNLVMPMLLALSGSMTLLGPLFVRARDRGDLPRLVRLTLALILGGALVHWLLLGLLHRPLFAVVYRGRYMDVSHLLWIAALVPVAAALTDVLGGAIRAAERPARVFAAFAIAAVLGAAVGILLIARYHIAGAFTAMVLCNAIAAAVLAIFHIRPGVAVLYRPPATPPTHPIAKDTILSHD